MARAKNHAEIVAHVHSEIAAGNREKLESALRMWESKLHTDYRADGYSAAIREGLGLPPRIDPTTPTGGSPTGMIIAAIERGVDVESRLRAYREEELTEENDW